MTGRSKIFAAVLAVGFAGLWAGGTVAQAQQVIVLVRHAEKVDQSDDSPLSAAGRARARRLADLLGAARVTHLFATQYRRTQATLAPLATREGLKTEVLNSDDIDGLLARLRALRAGDLAVYAGHSNSVPRVLKALGYTESVAIGDNDYGNLFIVVPRAEGPPTVLRLRF